MRGKTTWRVLFVVGIVAAVSATAIVFGTTSLTAIVAVVALLIAIINALFAKPGDTSGGFIQQWAKRLFNVSLFLQLGTGAVWLTAIGVGAYGVHGLVAKPAPRTLVTVGGWVRSPEGTPRAGATVYLEMAGRPRITMSREDGAFRFEDVDVTGYSRKTVDLNVTWREFRAVAEAALAMPQREQILVSVGPDPSPIRVTFLQFGGHTIDSLVQGKLDGDLAETIGGQPFIVQGDALQQASQLVRRFTAELYLEDSDDGKPQKLFVGAGHDDDAGVDPAAEQLASVRRGDPAWRVVLVWSAPPLYWRYSTAEDLKHLAPPILRKFYETLSSETTINDFFVTTLQEDECAQRPKAHLAQREMTIMTVVLQNVTNAPVEVGDLVEHVEGGQGLRKRNSAPSEVKTLAGAKWFPRRILDPKETILIPLWIAFGFNDESSNAGDLIPDEDEKTRRAKAIAKLQGVGADAKKYSLGLSGKALLEMLQRPDYLVEFARTDDRFLGPIVQLDTVEINGKRVPIRAVDPQNLMRRSGTAAGSCPVAYSRGDVLRREGEFMVGQSGKSREADDRRRLRSFTGKLRLVEEEDEVSYIDRLRVQCRADDQRMTVLETSDPKLRSADGSYLVLTRGELVDVEFEMPAGMPTQDCWLLSRGYYDVLDAQP